MTHISWLNNTKIMGELYDIKNDMHLFDPKKYTITTNYKGKLAKNTVTVKQVLTTSKVV